MHTNVEKINNLNHKSDFPIFERLINGKNLVYLDSAATSQKPKPVIDSINDFHQNFNSNVHRGVYSISVEATEKYENTRKSLANMINSKQREIIFTRNATEAINLVAYSWAKTNIKKDDVILLSKMEHHSNIIPWRLLSESVGCKIKYLEITDDGNLDLENIDVLLEDVKLVALTHASNVLGTINPLKNIGKLCKERGIKFLVDAAQSVPHMKVDVNDLGCDFLALTGHKMFGPSGIGALYAKSEILQNMDPFLGGGDMIKEVHLDQTIWNDIPWKFEAGTQNVGGTIGLGAAIKYIEKITLDSITKHEFELTNYAYEQLSSLGDIKIFGPTDMKSRTGLISFTMKGIHPHDIASILDYECIAVRAGHHCAQLLMDELGVPATTRISFNIYNTVDDVDKLIDGLKKVRSVLSK